MEFVSQTKCGKVREIENLLGNGFKLFSKELGFLPEETVIFLENALIKARNVPSNSCWSS